MNKIVFVINGRGGAGKDTVCDIVTRNIGAMNVSSITPIKDAAQKIGWNGEKDDRGRLLLARMKEALKDYDDRAHRYVSEKYGEFLQTPMPVMFVHIREPEEIERFKASVDGAKVRTLLVKRPATEGRAYGNSSDDGVNDYRYDYTYINDKPLEKMETDVLEFFGGLLAEEGIEFEI